MYFGGINETWRREKAHRGKWLRCQPSGCSVCLIIFERKNRRDNRLGFSDWIMLVFYESLNAYRGR